jgi:hypothetical protein
MAGPADGAAPPRPEFRQHHDSARSSAVPPLALITVLVVLILLALFS